MRRITFKIESQTPQYIISAGAIIMGDKMPRRPAPKMVMEKMPMMAMSGVIGTWKKSLQTAKVSTAQEPK